jgi:amino acid transporter
MRGDWLVNNFKVEGNESMINSLYTNVSPDFGKFLMENVSLFVSKIHLGILIFVVFCAFLYLIGSFGENGIMNSLNGVVYLVLLTIYITIVISTVRKEN